jgi:CheY-specific phosphatase CheX
MNDLQKDILNGLAIMVGVIGFMSGEFIISSALFAGTTVASNVNMNRKKQAKQTRVRLAG